MNFLNKHITKLIFVLLPLTVAGQARILKGTVTDPNKESLTGVNIILNDGEYATISGKNGEFRFPEIGLDSVKLQVSFLGFETFIYNFTVDSSLTFLPIQLKYSTKQIEEVMVESNKKRRLGRNESISIALIQEEFLKENQSGNLMQTLNKLPGVNSMDIGSGISKPMIRGMGYYRVLVAQDGIRQEGQQWSNHHGVDIDQNSVDHVEVIKGPAVLQYGSGAVGGVINVLPDHIPLSEGISGGISLVGKTNSGWIGTSGRLTARRGDLYLQATTSYDNFGDFKIPTTEFYLLPAPASASEASHRVKLGNSIYNSSGRNGAISLTAGVVKSWGNSYLELSYFESKLGFFDWQGIKHDSLRIKHASSYRDIKLPCQEVKNVALSHITNIFFNKNKLKIALGYQQNNSSEYSFLFDRTGNRTNDLKKYSERGNLDLWLRLNTLTSNLVYSIRKSKKNHLKFGFNTEFQHHSTDGYNHILPQYSRLTTGAFVAHKIFLSDKWILNGGLRFDYHLLKIEESRNPDTEFGDSIFNPYLRKVFPGKGLSIGVNYLPDNSSVLKLNIGTSYRVPSVYELAAYGLHRHENRFEKGDTEIISEQSWQFDLGYEKSWSALTITVSPFLNYFTNYLYLKPTPILRPEGQVYKYSQNNALITGGEVSCNYSYHRILDLLLGAEYVYAVNLDLQMAIPFTPPVSLFSEVAYSFKDMKWFTGSRIGIDMEWVGTQNYTAPNELSTPGYTNLGIHAKTELNTERHKLNIMIRVRNVLNGRHYSHNNFYRRLRIPEPGRSIELFMSFPFNS